MNYRVTQRTNTTFIPTKDSHMADLRGFDAQTVEPNDSFDPLPNGDYLCIITASEMKPTKAW